MSAQSNRQEASLSDNPNPHPQAVDSEPTPSRPVNTAFGLKQDAQRPHKTVFKDNYEERFPEDPYCQEVAPNARVWRTYEEEAAAYDAVMVGQSRDGLDVMLVFAGLFSAVVTSFLVQVCQKLEADFSQMSAILMHDLVLVQLSMAAGSSGPNLTAPSVDPTMVYSPDTVTVWVNGLWAVSLAASLIVAFAAVLVKPWLRHYASLPSGTPGARSHIRHYRFMGLEKWRVSVIIGLLPIIMNISLTLFFVGLILFFVPLQTSLASVISAITLTVTVLYFVSNAMPIFYPQCPYQTPLTDFVYRAFQAASSIRQHLFTHEEQKSCFSLRELETKVVSDNYDMLSVCAIDWLFDVSLNPTVHSVVVQALGGLPASIQSYTMEYPWRNGGEMARVRSESFGRIAAKLEPSPYSTNISSLACIVGRENICDRLMRSYLFLPSGHQYVVIDDGRDAPHFRASLWLRRPSSYLSAESSAVIRSRLRACLAFNCHVELHPLVLVNLMKVAIAYDVLAPANLNNSRECAVVIDLWFQATCTESKDHTLKNEPSMLEQVRTIPLSLTLAGVSNESNAFLQGHLLKFLSVHDNLQDSSFSLSFRLALAVGKFGVSHVAQHFSSRWCDLDGWRHLHLINCALDSLIDTPYSHAVIEPICCFIMNVIDTTPVCDYNPQLWENPVIGACLVHCLSQIRELLSAHNDIMLPPHSLSKLLQIPAQHLLQDLGIFWRPATFPHDFYEKTVHDTLEMFFRLLIDGTKGAHHVFVTDDWLKILAESWLVNMNPQRFVDRGWKRSCDHLRNIWPSHVSWCRSYVMLHKVVRWSRNPDGAEFPLKGFFKGKVVKIDDVEISLDDELKEVLGQDRLREALDLMEQCLLSDAFRFICA